jgi:hypothetical protein
MLYNICNILINGRRSWYKKKKNNDNRLEIFIILYRLYNIEVPLYKPAPALGIYIFFLKNSE